METNTVARLGLPMGYSSGGTLTIGREAQCDVVLNFPEVSRRHARVIFTNGQVVLEDLQSTNGTYLNGQRISRAALSTSDTVQVGRATLVFDGSSLHPRRHEFGQPMRVDVVGLAQTAGRKEILHDISFSILPSELVAIVGPSGAGKTTLLKAITGSSPGVRGAVFLNGVSFYEHPFLFRTALGYVPQDDIVHRELTVEQALQYAIQLRFAGDVTSHEMETQVHLVLRELDLAPHSVKQVRQLSGGQRKRVNVAIELVACPTLLVLDEPTTGLDPHLERDFIHLCQRMTSNGRTVVLTTHSTQALALCALVLFVAPGGYLVFYGPPRDALHFFGVVDYPDIYTKLQRGPVTPEAWARRYKQSDYFENYVRGRLANASRSAPAVSAEDMEQLFDVRRFGVLVRRYVSVLLADRVNTAVFLLQAPVIAGILTLIFPADAFTGTLDPEHLNYAGRVVFLMVISAIWFGTMNAAREIVKERPIFLRERMTALPVASYLASKVAVLGALCLLQVFLLVGILGVRMGGFDVSLQGLLELYSTLALAAFGGTAMGLVVSAATASSDQAISLTPVVLIIQVALSGMFINPEQLNVIMRVLSKLTVAHWGFASVGHVVDLNGKIAALARGLPAARQAIFDQSPVLTASVLVFLTLCFLMLAGVMLQARGRD